MNIRRELRAWYSCNRIMIIEGVVLWCFYLLVIGLLMLGVSKALGEDKYLGRLSDNKYDADSVSNPYGKYGSKYSPDSINNPYGKYGSKYSSESPNNPYATNPPVIVNDRNNQPILVVPDNSTKYPYKWGY